MSALMSLTALVIGALCIFREAVEGSDFKPIAIRGVLLFVILTLNNFVIIWIVAGRQG